MDAAIACQCRVSLVLNSKARAAAKGSAAGALAGPYVTVALTVNDAPALPEYV
jgi:hypothetical protein